VPPSKSALEPLAIEVREDRAAPAGNLVQALAALLIATARRQLAEADPGEAPRPR
jgi:hypothetical protein